MSSTSTNRLLELLPITTDQNLMAGQIHAEPEQQFLSRRDWVEVSHREQAAMGTLVNAAASKVRAQHRGRCPTKALAEEMTSRMSAAVRQVAGLKDSRDGKLLSSDEIQRIRDPEARAYVQDLYDLMNGKSVFGETVYGSIPT